MIDWSKSIETEHGAPVRLLCCDGMASAAPYIVQLHSMGSLGYSYYSDGMPSNDAVNAAMQVMRTELPRLRNVQTKTIERTGYINIYRKPDGRYVCSPYPYFNRADAEEVASPDKGDHSIGTVTWTEVEDGNE